MKRDSGTVAALPLLSPAAFPTAEPGTGIVLVSGPGHGDLSCPGDSLSQRANACRSDRGGWEGLKNFPA